MTKLFLVFVCNSNMNLILKKENEDTEKFESVEK